MDRKIVEIKRLKEDFIYLKNKSGLKIFLKPMENFSTAVAIFCTRYGSVNRSFRKKGSDEFITVPDGIAHYLEHKLFENEDDSVTFELFAKEKALANAETSFDSTAYYFVSPKKTFVNALKILLNFVQKPYFTDENVEKERGIIAQEIKMGEDDPFWNTFFKCLECMYLKSAINIKIAGSVESIAKIDKEILYKCYDHFYNPNNMALVLAGNFKEEEILELLKTELAEKEAFDVDRIVEEEQKEVVLGFYEMKMPVKTPVFCIGFKIVPKRKEEILKFKIGFKILLEILFGEGSFLYNLFYKKGLVLGSQLDYDIFAGGNYFALILNGESYDPKKVLDEISREIEKKKREGIGEKEFQLVKKTVYKDIVLEFSTPEKLAGFFTDCYIENSDVSMKIEEIVNIKKEDILSCLKEIDLKNCSLVVTSPLDED